MFRKPLFWALLTLLSLGVLFLVLYIYALRFDLLVIPFGMAAAGILGLLRQALQQAYPRVEIHLAGAVIGVGLAAWWFHRRLAGLTNYPCSLTPTAWVPIIGHSWTDGQIY
jgi:hypothetical protein